MITFKVNVKVMDLPTQQITQWRADVVAGSFFVVFNSDEEF